jgi:hypothetical protein
LLEQVVLAELQELAVLVLAQFTEWLWLAVAQEAVLAV